MATDIHCDMKETAIDETFKQISNRAVAAEAASSEQGSARRRTSKKTYIRGYSRCQSFSLTEGSQLA
jgi:hypothetical protein